MTLAKNHVSNQLEIVTTGGINAIVTAMNMHNDNVAIQQYSCERLLTLVQNHVYELEIITARGVNAIVAAMLWHDTTKAIQDCG